MSKPFENQRTAAPGKGWAGGLGLFLLILLAYQPVVYSGFIWDDFKLLLSNPCIAGPFGLKEIWTTRAADVCPLTMTTFWVEHALWGFAPLPYHLVNVFLHGACAAALWRVLLGLRVPGAWLGAAIWALHPVNVESVAWISELKNTQSGFFFLLSIFFFGRWLETPAHEGGSRVRRNYFLMLVLAALALASKSSTVILPVVLCLCAWWMEGRWRWRNLVSVAPVFVMSIFAAASSLWTEGLQLAATTDPLAARSWPERLVTAGDAVWFYLGKLLWPHPLIVIYPGWEINPARFVSYLPLLAVILVLFLLWRQRGSWTRPGFFVFAYFLVALLPGLGLVDNILFRYSPVFDHLQYLAAMGPCALAGAGAVGSFKFREAGNKALRSSLCAGLLVAFGLLTWHRTWVYESEETLWSDTLAKNPDCWAAYNNLGVALVERGRVDEAIADYRKAIELNPRMAEGYNDLGFALVKKGQLDEAITQYHKALEINPRLVLGHYNLGKALVRKGQVPEGVAEFQKALTLNSNLADVHNDFGTVLLQQGQGDAAIQQYRQALALHPDLALAHYNLAMALSQKGDIDEAINQYQKAIALDPNDAEAHNNLGIALAQKGDADGAMDQFEKAVANSPDDAEAHENLGSAFLQKGQTDAAIAQYQKAAALSPSDAELHNVLGLALGRKGQLAAALAQFQEAVRLKPDYAEAQGNLAKAKASVPPAPGAK